MRPRDELPSKPEKRCHCVNDAARIKLINIASSGAPDLASTGARKRRQMSLRLRGPCKCVEVQVYSLQEAREPLQKEMLLVLLANGLLQMLLEPCELCRCRDGVGFPGGIETRESDCWGDY
jgi:hypothetical protein